MKTFRIPLIHSTICVASLAVSSTFAATWIWDGPKDSTGDYNWSTDANWDPDGDPANAADTIISVSDSNGFDIATDVSGISFGRINVVVTNSYSTFRTSSANTITLANSASPFIVDTTGSNGSSGWSPGGVLASTGTQGLQKLGNGVLSFRWNSNVQTYQGLVDIVGGGILITRNESLGHLDNDIRIGNASLSHEGASSTYANLVLTSGRTIELTNSNSRIITNGTAGSSARNIEIQGLITGSGSLVKEGGNTLSISGSGNNYAGQTVIKAGTLALSGGNNRLPTGTTLNFSSASALLNLGGNSQQVASLVLGTNDHLVSATHGSLTVTGNQNLSLSSQVVNGTHDLSGLSSFTYDGSGATARILTLGNEGAGGDILTLRLASSNSITVDKINLGDGGPSDDVSGTFSELRLGTTNQIHADTMLLGGYRSGGTIKFDTGVTNGTLTLRGEAGGTFAMDSLIVGQQNSGGTGRLGTLDLTNGSIDAKVTNFVVGQRNGAGSPSGTVIMPVGTVEAANLHLANYNGGSGNNTLTGTFTQGGGSVSATTLTLGTGGVSGSTAKLKPTYNLNGGTLFAQSITAGTGSYSTSGTDTVRDLNLAGGTLRNLAGSDLAIDGLNTTSSGRINLNASAASTIHADVGRTVTFGGNTSLDGSGDLTKTGSGALVINGSTSTYSGTLSVDQGSLGGTTTFGGALALGSAGTIAPGNSIGTIAAESLVWEGLGLMSFELSNVDATSDLLSLTGDFSKGGGSGFVFDFNASGLAGETYTLVTFGGTDFDEADFSYSNLSSGNTGEFTLSGGSLTFTVVPEPQAALLGGLGLLILLRRRRCA